MEKYFAPVKEVSRARRGAGSLRANNAPLMPSLMPSPRAGARRRSEIPGRLLEQLNRGQLEATTLDEVLAIDFARLLVEVAPDVPKPALVVLRTTTAAGVTERMALAGRVLLEHCGPAAYLRFARHRSDTVRGWAAYLLAATQDFTLAERLQLVRVLANDRNASVREWAWLALRPLLALDIEHSIRVLEPWTISTSPFLRRFAVEATRPRGQWCTHIDALKLRPELGLPILEPLRADPHQYVQNSVASWLQDTAKSQPEWVRELCGRWSCESLSPATDRICRRALRSLRRG